MLIESFPNNRNGELMPTKPDMISGAASYLLENQEAEQLITSVGLHGNFLPEQEAIINGYIGRYVEQYQLINTHHMNYTIAVALARLVCHDYMEINSEIAFKFISGRIFQPTNLRNHLRGQANDCLPSYEEALLVAIDLSKNSAVRNVLERFPVSISSEPTIPGTKVLHDDEWLKEYILNCESSYCKYGMPNRHDRAGAELGILKYALLLHNFEYWGSCSPEYIPPKGGFSGLKDPDLKKFLLGQNYVANFIYRFDASECDRKILDIYLGSRNV